METGKWTGVSGAHEEGFKLLTEDKVQEFNSWRMRNLTVKLDFAGRNFSSKNISGAYLNGVIADKANFAHANLTGTNLVQATLNGASFEGADLTEALLMYTEMKDARLVGANLTKTNLMWANLQGADFTGSKMFQTVMVEANAQNAKVTGIDKAGAYLKYAILEGTAWFEQTEKH